MTTLTPWYKVVAPRADLRENRPLDAAEFAVHLDQVREGRAPSVYQQPAEFFARTYLTAKLRELAAEVLARLLGSEQHSAVYNLATQFGGGKTHALTLLYHLARHGQAARQWQGVSDLMQQVDLPHLPSAQVAVFVGQQFDALRGRGGQDGTPHRRTPWGEIVYQLGGEAAFAWVADHDAQGIAPGGDVLARALPETACLILMDEVMNYVSRSRRVGDAVSQFYNFLHNLTEAARSRRGLALVVSVQKSELEMSSEDESDYQRLEKLLNRVSKHVLISAEDETSEIIRRRLFEWEGLPSGAEATLRAYARWVADHEGQLSELWTEAEAYHNFAAAYPFHPSTLSVFKRKWQTLPSFQRTRGVLQMLARWVSLAYRSGYENNMPDALLDLGSAPLEDADFRTAVLEQLGESRLEAAITADIADSAQRAHALRLDAEAQASLRSARLHRRAAASIFFESNGGQQRSVVANLSEIRLAVGGPHLDIGNIETALEALSDQCYYLTVDGASYRFSTRENLVKKHATLRAQLGDDEVQERLESEIQAIFSLRRALADRPGAQVQAYFFPAQSSAIPNLPQLTLVVMPPQVNPSAEVDDELMSWTQSCGASARQFKNALVFCLADQFGPMRDAAKNLMAWERIQAEGEGGEADAEQLRQIVQHRERAARTLRETIWRSYRHLRLLGRDASLKALDLGMVTASAASTPVHVILERLEQLDEVLQSVGVSFLVRNWPAQAFWPTRAVRDAFFAAPSLPRLLNPQAIRETIARGVSEGQLALASLETDEQGRPRQIIFRRAIAAHEVELSDQVALLRAGDAERLLQAPPEPPSEPSSPAVEAQPAPVVPEPQATPTEGLGQPSALLGLSWEGPLEARKWTLFYNRVLALLPTDKLRLRIRFEYHDPQGLHEGKLNEVRQALRLLGLPDEVARRE